jgi:hypothetical protein
MPAGKLLKDQRSIFIVQSEGCQNFGEVWRLKTVEGKLDFLSDRIYTISWDVGLRFNHNTLL